MALTFAAGSARANVLEHFRSTTNASDFGECNALLVYHDVTGDQQPEVFLTHRELRVGGVHTWFVYTHWGDDRWRFLGSVDVHPRGFRVTTGQAGFYTFAGEVFNAWVIDTRGLHAGEAVPQSDPTLEPVTAWLQRCTEGAVTWIGADDAVLADVAMEGDIVSGAETLAGAARAGDVQTLDTLLGSWIAMYARDNAGAAALSAAAGAGQDDAVRFLLGRSNHHPQTALHDAVQAAAANGQIKALGLLLAAAADDTRQLAQGGLATASQAGNAAGIDLLLDAGADPNAPTSQWDPRSPVELAAQAGHDNVIQAFRDAGVDTHRAREIALFAAVDRGDRRAVRKLIRSGVSTEARHPGSTRTPALTWAIRTRKPEIAAELIALDADIEVRDPRGNTPLIMAASYADLATVSALLDRGADPNVTNRFGVDPLTAVTGTGDVTAMRFVLERTSTRLPENALDSALIAGARRGAAGAVCLLLERGADPKWTNQLQRTAAEEARFAGQDEIVALLADPSAACAALSEDA